MFFLRFLTSSIGKKIIMSVTGMMLFGFLIIHMVGNWHIFQGQDDLNAYAKFLKHYPLVIWGFRLGLLAIVALHLWSAISLTLANRAARPEGYHEPKSLGANAASLTMAVSGTVVLAFTIYHILHFTAHLAPNDPSIYGLTDAAGRPDVYNMVVYAFQSPIVSGIYIASVAFLCFHLSHGLQAMFRSLGLSNRAYLPLQKLFAIGGSLMIFLGMSAVPASVLLKIVKPATSSATCPVSSSCSAPKN